MTRVHSFSLSERGLRETNDDAFCTEQVGACHVFAVAGGRIGFPAGREAGGIAIASLLESVKVYPGDPIRALEQAIADADARIGAAGTRDREHAGMGTSLSACIVDNNLDCTILDAGIGGIYYLSPGSGIVLPHEIPFSENAVKPAKKSMVTHIFGEPHVIRGTEFNRVNLMNSFIILSSEGLYDYVKREEIRVIVERNGENVDTSCEELKDRALLAGSDKTITMIVIHGHME